MAAADDANQRLDAALARLESSLQARQAAQSDAVTQRAQLEQEVAAVRNKITSLRETSAQVSRRLDAAIGAVKGILAE